MPSMNHAEEFSFTKSVRLIWPFLFKPKPANPRFQSKAKWEAKLAFPLDHPFLMPMQQVIARVAQGAFGRTTGVGLPLKQGDALADEGAAKGKDWEFLRGTVLLTVHSNTENTKGEALWPPSLVVVQNGKYVPYRDEDRGLAEPFFYPGVGVVGRVKFVPYEGFGGGISAYINELVSLNVGERLKGAVPDYEAMYGEVAKHHTGHVSSEDPAAGPLVF